VRVLRRPTGTREKKKKRTSPAREGRADPREGRARTAHEGDREASALDEARAERVEAAGGLVRAGRGEYPAERRGRGLPTADAAGGLLRGEVGGARGHPGGCCAGRGAGGWSWDGDRGEWWSGDGDVVVAVTDLAWL
jgi:hypothetical protein